MQATPLRRPTDPQTGGRSAYSGPRIGLLEWFQLGEYERVEQVIEVLKQLGVVCLRTGISWADWHTEQGESWYEWLLPRLAREVEVLPCLLYTPPSLGITAHTASPPRNPKLYADCLDVLITRFGHTFEWIELWNEPTNLSEWDWTLDPSWEIFCEMVGGAAYWARQRGKKTVLAGMSPIDPHWLGVMFQRGIMDHIDAVGIHGFPGVWEQVWHGWDAALDSVRAVLEMHEHPAQVWITEAGFSTWQHDEKAQVEAFAEALRAPAERLYWYSVQDLAEDRATVDGFHLDEREYHFGLTRTDGTPKLLGRLWADGGLARVQEVASIQVPTRIDSRNEGHVLITGGAGFVGTNLAHRCLSQGRQVMIYDNLSRPGVEENLAWLRSQHGNNLLVKIADVRNGHKVKEAVAGAEVIYHLAGQVAVTTSLANPVTDFEINARGTLNLLEAVRQQGQWIPLLFTSTNKVYGDLADVALAEKATHYKPTSLHVHERGIDERRALCFHSPYGCSKGAADQYVLDYARSYDLPAVVLRMSCIYGPHQFGTEDQGWVAHFLIQALNDQPITIYGDGKQVRDVLFVDDLVDAFERVHAHIEALAGQAFNLGGGPENQTSLIQLVRLIETIQQKEVTLTFDRWRRGDQRYYVSDVDKLARATEWRPKISLIDGIHRLYHWLRENRRQKRETPAASLRSSLHPSSARHKEVAR